MSRPFGILYDSTFDAIYDPYDVRYGHVHVPQQPQGFASLRQCGVHSIAASVPYLAFAAAAVALGVVLLRTRK